MIFAECLLNSDQQKTNLNRLDFWTRLRFKKNLLKGNYQKRNTFRKNNKNKYV